MAFTAIQNHFAHIQTVWKNEIENPEETIKALQTITFYFSQFETLSHLLQKGILALCDK